MEVELSADRHWRKAFLKLESICPEVICYAHIHGGDCHARYKFYHLKDRVYVDIINKHNSEKNVSALLVRYTWCGDVYLLILDANMEKRGNVYVFIQKEYVYVLFLTIYYFFFSYFKLVEFFVFHFLLAKFIFLSFFILYILFIYLLLLSFH